MTSGYSISLFYILLVTVLLGDLSFSRGFLFSIEEATAQSRDLQLNLPSAVKAALMLPHGRLNELQHIADVSTTNSHLETLLRLIGFHSGFNSTDLYLDPSGFSKVTTHPGGAIAIYYCLTPIQLGLGNQSYALLMLKFTNPASYSGEPLKNDVIHHNVGINGTNGYSFKGNGATDTGVDIMVIRDISLIKDPRYPGNYYMVVDVPSINNNPVYETTTLLSANFSN